MGYNKKNKTWSNRRGDQRGHDPYNRYREDLISSRYPIPFSAKNLYVYYNSLSLGSYSPNQIEFFLAQGAKTALFGRDSSPFEQRRNQSGKTAYDTGMEFLKNIAKFELEEELKFLTSKAENNEVLKRFLSENKMSFNKDGSMSFDYDKLIIFINTLSKDIEALKNEINLEINRIEAYKKGSNFRKKKSSSKKTNVERKTELSRMGEDKRVESGTDDEFKELLSNESSEFSYEGTNGTLDARKTTINLDMKPVLDSILQKQGGIQQEIADAAIKYLLNNTSALQAIGGNKAHSFVGLATLIITLINDRLIKEFSIHPLSLNMAISDDKARRDFLDGVMQKLSSDQSFQTILNTSTPDALESIAERFYNITKDNDSRKRPARAQALKTALQKMLTSIGETPQLTAKGKISKKNLDVINERLGFTEDDIKNIIGATRDTTRRIQDVHGVDATVDFRASEVLATSDLLRMGIVATLNGQQNLPSDIHGGYLDIKYKIDDTSIEKQILESVNKEFEARYRQLQKRRLQALRSLKKSGDESSSSLDAARAEESYIKEAEKLLQQYKDDLAKIEIDINECMGLFSVQTNVKGYISIDSSGASSFHGQSFGGNITSQLETISAIAGSMGMDFDSEWLKLAAINAGANALGGFFGLKEKIGAYLSMFAGLLMFDDYTAVVSNMMKNLQSSTENNFGVHTLSLYNFNGFIVPSSYILYLTYNSLKKVLSPQVNLIDSYIKSKSGAKMSFEKVYNPTIHTDNNGSRPPEGYSGFGKNLSISSWEQIGQEALSNTKLKIAIFADFSNLLLKLQESINNISIN